MSSTENRPDPDRDERIDAAWRAASGDEPPAALDELIRAAARREVAAGPLPSRRQPTWMRALPSLAAAAAVAVIAVGVVQLAPPEQVAPMPTTASHGDASDAAPATAPAAAKPTARGDSPAKEESSSSDQRRPDNPRSKAAAPLDSLAESPRPASTSGRPAVPAPSASVPPAAPSASAPAAAGPTRSASDAEPAVPAPSAVPAPRPQARHSEPFPAANTAAGTAPAAKVSSSASERDEASQAAISLSKDLAPSPQAPSPQAPSPQAPSPQSPAQPASRYAGGQLASHNEPSERADRAKTAGVAAAAQSDALAKEAPARTIDDWVRRLRRLKEQGATEELQKELAAFRVIYGAGANALLPADLRDIKP